MALKGSPAPHWTNPPGTAADARRLVLYRDASGFWVLRDDIATPSGAFVDDASGFTVIDDTVISGLKPTLLPSGKVVIY